MDKGVINLGIQFISGRVWKGHVHHEDETCIQISPKGRSNSSFEGFFTRLLALRNHSVTLLSSFKFTMLI